MWKVVQLFTYSGYPVFLYVCIPVYVHSPEESITCPVGSLSYAIETGLALSLVPVILLSLHTCTEHCSYRCPPASPSDPSASAPHLHIHTESYWCMHSHTQLFMWVLGSKLGSSYLYSKCFYLQSPGNLTRAGRE